MKSILIWLSVLMTLSQSDESKDNLSLRVQEKPKKSPKDLEAKAFVAKYLSKKRFRDDVDAVLAKEKVKIVKDVRNPAESWNGAVRDPAESWKGAVRDPAESWNAAVFVEGNEAEAETENPRYKMGYKLDAVLNKIRRKGSDDSSSLSKSDSSSREFARWQDEWRQMWEKKKLEVFNKSDPGGDRVNMIAARPWGVPCGDPAQHDMPWGSCVLAVECNSEFRIYRGDYFCGRTQFVCCAMQFHTYDLYQGFDVSLEESSFEKNSDSEREKAKLKTSKERRKKALRRKRRRRRLREERKKRIRRNIKRIVKEVRRILDKAYKNSSRMRKRKTSTMKKFIKYLKKQYKLDRESAKDIHENMVFEIDQDFIKKLREIKDLNHEFMTNDTFRLLLTNNSISAKTARMLSDAYPEIRPYLPKQLIPKNLATLFDATRTKAERRRGSFRRRSDVSRRRSDVSRRRSDVSRRGSGVFRRGGIFGRLSPNRRRVSRLQRSRKHKDYDFEY